MGERETGDDPEHPRTEVFRPCAREKHKTPQRGPRMRQIDRTEKYPRETNPVHREQPGEPTADGSRTFRNDTLVHFAGGRKNFLPFVRASLPLPIDDQGEAVQPAPDHERPRSTVPEAAEQHRDHDVAVNEPRRPAISAERNVKIIAQPARETDMPAMPELRDVL